MSDAAIKEAIAAMNAPATSTEAPADAGTVTVADTPAPGTDAPATTTVTEAPPPAAPEPSVARGYAEVVKMQKALKDAREQFEAERHNFTQEQERFKQQNASNADLRAALAQDPFGTLEKLGLPFTKLSQLAVADDAPPPNPLEATVRELVDMVKELKAGKQQETDNALKSEIAKAVNQYLDDGESRIQAEKYQILQTMPDFRGSLKALGDAFANRTGRVLPIEEALDTLAEHWGEQVKKTYTHGAVAKLLGVQAPQQATPAQPEASASAATDDRPPVTLNSDMVNSPAKGKKPPLPTTLTERQEIEAALALIQKPG